MCIRDSVWHPSSWCGFSQTVWVTVAWYWHFLYQHRTGAGDSEGIRPETDTENGWEAINWGSPWWGITGRGVSSSNLSWTQSPSLEVWLFLVQSVTSPVGHSSDVKQRPKNSTMHALEKEVELEDCAAQWPVNTVFHWEGCFRLFLDPPQKNLLNPMTLMRRIWHQRSHALGGFHVNLTNLSRSVWTRSLEIDT